MVARLVAQPITVSLKVDYPKAVLKAQPVAIVDMTTPYEGEYEFAPTSEYQTISISGLKAEHDIIIDPIPSNYGLITWNGSTLTVS